MSSTERAPEPTMEEILSSIRRIITDDEKGQARAQDAAEPARKDDENLEGEGEADSQIIDDIARVLSGGAQAAEVDEEEEILDLTSELGGLELVEEVEQPEAEAAAPVPPSPPAEELTQEAVAPQMEVPQPAAPQAPTPEPAQAASPQPSASQEAASALERAIAALRAGQVPTSTSPQVEPFQFQAAPQPETMSAPEAEPMPEPMPEPMAAPEPMPELQPEPETVPMAIPMEAPEPLAETHPEAEPQFEAEPAPALELMSEPGAEAELVLTEIEMTVVTETEETVELEAEEPESETASFWPTQDAPEAEVTAESEPEPEPETEPTFAQELEPEPVAAQVNGAGTHEPEGASRTLEDSVKDMLRPMLREWLDENMPRMVTAALKDELDPNAFRPQD